MRRLSLGLMALFILFGCGRWGGYAFKSDRFKYKVVFPEKWEVWDRSDDTMDYLIGSLPEDIPSAQMVVRAVPVAPDLSPNEIYPSFIDGSEYADRIEFRIEDKGAVSCKNAEGPFIKYIYLGEKDRMRGMKAMFIGNRVLIEVSMEMPQDQFIVHEVNFTKMIHLMEL